MIHRFIIQCLRPRKAGCMAAAAALVCAFTLPAQGSVILVDFGPSNDDDGRATTSPDTNGNYWNSWRPKQGYSSPADYITVGTTSSTLVDTNNVSTTITLEVTDDFQSNGRVNGGLLSPSAALLGDFAVGTATEDYFYVSSTEGATPGIGAFVVTGLDTNLTYNFRFFGTRETTTTRETTYTATGANGPFSVDLTTSGNNIGNDGIYDGNNDTIVSLNGLQPNGSGEIEISFAVKSGSFGYLGIMEITAVPEPSMAILGVFGILPFVFHRRRK